MQTFSGLQVIIAPHLDEYVRTQVRWPRSKRKRMRRKWAKQAHNYTLVHMPNAIRLNGQLHMGPRSWQALRTAANAESNSEGDAVVENKGS